MQKPLSALATSWTAGQTTDAGKLAALSRHLLSGYTYSLHFERKGSADPILEFLREQKQGHCEYFASALALLSRAAGVPARVIGGYRVTERNRLGDYDVVRERNAHAWVEAYLPGVGGDAGWVSFDPTPAGSPPGQKQNTAFLPALFDLLRARVAAGLNWVGERSKAQLGAGLSAVLAVLFFLRWYFGREVVAPDKEDRLGRPLPAYERLEISLAARGTPRPSWEPLEDFAARVADPEVAALISRYAALRYGGEGSEEQMTTELALCAERIEGQIKT